MKKYKNGMSSTSFTRGQVGFIYRGAKEGNVVIAKWVIAALYDLAEFYGYPNKAIKEAEEIAEVAIDNAIKGNWERVQANIEDFAEAYLQTGLKRSREAGFVRGKKIPDVEVLEDLIDED